MHVRNGALRVALALVQDVSNSLVHQELRVQRHFQVDDGAVGAENLAQVRGVDVFGEFLDDDFRRADGGGGAGSCW